MDRAQLEQDINAAWEARDSINADTAAPLLTKFLLEYSINVLITIIIYLLLPKVCKSPGNF